MFEFKGNGPFLHQNILPQAEPWSASLSRNTLTCKEFIFIVKLHREEMGSFIILPGLRIRHITRQVKSGGSPGLWILVV